MPRYAQPRAIAPEDLHTLRQWSRSSSVRAGLAERAKILLLAAEGLSNTQIAQQLGCSRPTVILWRRRYAPTRRGGFGPKTPHQLGCPRPTVILWRRRYAQTGLDGLADKPRPGRPQTVRKDRQAEILAATLRPPPERLGVTHWSTRLLAAELGVSHNTVARSWRDHDLKPWRLETFKF